ncbi:phosphate ABC transporter substrate-binding protein PstS [Hydrogenophaga sp.]|uniref:phosphate ABC transporter substrate-binding protein PstS n=1 Tax=Hydrogenophaga sp. TaxID=1904254 RepID=UPI00356A909F
MNLNFSKTFVAAVVAAAAASSAFAQDVTGAGASFPAPIYAKWAEAYKAATGKTVNYQSIGSSGGIKQIKAKTVDFGATDDPMAAADVNADGMVQFPAIIGGVVPIYNLEGIPSMSLKLTGEVLADIFMGKITKWNDAKITGLNPGVNLPDQVITVSHRADGSGTTATFTGYLSEVSSDFEKAVGAGKAVKWPADTSVGGKGNAGVAANVQKIKGAIGYVEYAYAKSNKMPVIMLRNKDGKYVKPDSDTFAAAAAGADWSKAPAMALSLNNQPGAMSWPITTASFILMYKQPTDATKSKESLAFFDWAFKSGGKLADELDYVAMPSVATDYIRKSVWTQIKN